MSKIRQFFISVVNTNDFKFISFLGGFFLIGYTTKVEDIDIALTKNLSEILSDFERQKYEMAAQRDQIEMQKKLADKQSQSKYFGLFG